MIDNEKRRAVKGYVWSVVDVMERDRFFFYEHGSGSGRLLAAATCKARGVDERTWLEDVLRRSPVTA